jgi:hypothetical protein
MVLIRLIIFLKPIIPSFHYSITPLLHHSITPAAIFSGIAKYL